MFTKIVEITVPILVLTLAGFFYAKRFKPDLAGSNKMVVDIALPVLIFTSLSSKYFDPSLALSFAGASIAMVLLSGLIAWPLVQFSGVGHRAFLPCAMFTNVGPIGIPLIALSYGPDGMVAVMVLLVISNILHFTLGVGILTGKVNWRMVYANPLVWATVLGIGSSQWHIALPVWLYTSLSMIGNVLVPMMLLSLGAKLASSQIEDASTGFQASILVLLTRLLAAVLVLWAIPLQGVERGALILFACMPPAVFNFMLAEKFQVEPLKVASMVMMGHICSLVFLPLGIWLAFM